MFSEEFLEQNRLECEEEERQFKASGGPQKETFKNLLNYLYEKNDNYDINKQKLENTLGVLYLKEKIYAIEGGSCWDGADEYNNYETSVSDKSIISSITCDYDNVITRRFENINLDPQKLEEWTNNNIKSMSKYSYIKDFHESEYYGNSSNYGIYKIDFNALINEVCNEDDKKYYEEIKANFIPEPKKQNKNGYW